MNILFFSSACAIELEDTVVVTGGWSLFTGPFATVQVYTISGPQEQLPDMLRGRLRHACAHYVDSQNRVVSIILTASHVTVYMTLYEHVQYKYSQ